MSAQEPVQPFSLYQFELFGKALTGERSEQPIAWDRLERAAAEAMGPAAVAWVYGSAGTEGTARANLDAFARRRIVPRMLRDVEARELAVEVLGQAMPAPLLLAPVGVQSVIHEDAELASSRAAAAVGLTYVASTVSSFTLEEIADAGGPRWYQLYWPRDDEIARSLVGRAEAAGYTALVVTLDSFAMPWRPRDLEQGSIPFLQGIGISNYLTDPAFLAPLDKPPDEDIGPALARFAAIFGNPTLTWDDLERLRGMTSLPIVLKGIQHPGDAQEALARGVDGVVVSNHGGRQVDGAVASLDALPAIVAAVGESTTVLFDSGVRSGADVVKALALGADAVLVGRPYLWGLAVGGQAGVEQVLRALLAELDLTMALSGNRTVAGLGPESLASA